MMLHIFLSYVNCQIYPSQYEFLRAPPNHDTNLPHLTATLVQDAKAFVLHLEQTQRALGSVHGAMDYAPRCLVSHCESSVNVIMVSLQYV